MRLTKEEKRSLIQAALSGVLDTEQLPSRLLEELSKPQQLSVNEWTAVRDRAAQLSPAEARTLWEKMRLTS